MSNLTNQLTVTVAGLRGPGGEVTPDLAALAEGVEADKVASTTARDQAQGFAASAAQAAAVIVGTAQLGIGTAPATGTNAPAGTVLMLETPVGPNAAFLTDLYAFSTVATAAVVTVCRNTRSGTAGVNVATYTFPTSGAGAKHWTAADFGSIPVLEGEYLTISANVAGIVTYNAGTVAGAGYYTVTSGGTAVSALNTANHLEVRAVYSTQTFSNQRFTSLQASASMIAMAIASLAANYSDQVVGISANPVDGTVFGSPGSFLMQTAVSKTGYLSYIKIFAKTYGTITIKRRTKSGNTLTEIASYTVTVSRFGLQTLTPQDFGTIPVAKGEYLEVVGPGILTYNTGTVSGGGYYAVTGNAAGALVTNLHLEVQIGVKASTAVSESRLAELAPSLSYGSTRVGIAADPVTGSAIGAGTFYALENPVRGGGRYIASIKAYAVTPGAFVLERQQHLNGVKTTIASYTIAVAAGPVNLTPADLGFIPVQDGEWLAIDGGGILTYNNGTVAGGSYRIINPTTGVVGALVTATHLELQINVATAPAAQPRSAPAWANTPLCTDGRSLTAWKGKAAKWKRNGTGKVKIVGNGDSWIEQPRFLQMLATFLYGKMAKGGEGWISVGANVNGLGPLNLTTFTRSAGWTYYDASTGTAVPAGGCGPDGQALYTTAADQTASFTVNATEIHLLYGQTTGTFRYRVDGGAWQSVVGSGTNALGVVTINGLSSANHIVDIDTNGNTGTALLRGFYATNTAGAGVEIIKMGNSGATSLNFGLFVDTQLTAALADIMPDIYISMRGTNDYRISGNTPDQYVDVLNRERNAVLAANPNCAFVVIMPARSGGVPVYGLSDYRDAGYRWAISVGAEWLNLHDLFDTYAVENAAGMWLADGTQLHLSDDGAYRASAGELAGRLLLPGTPL